MNASASQDAPALPPDQVGVKEVCCCAASVHLASPDITGQSLQISLRPEAIDAHAWLQVKLILMPITLMGIQYGLTAAAQSIGSADPTADALAQWLKVLTLP